MNALTSRIALAAVLAVSLIWAAPPAAEAADPAAELEITVHGTADGGIVNWALYADEKQYDDDKPVRGGKAAAEGESTAVSLGAVPPGRYSIAVFLDADSNGEFDTNFFGIPKEPFGFSNDALGTMGKPDFESASFVVGPEGARIEMTLIEF